VTSCPQPRNRPGRVHLCKLRHPPPTTLALPLAGRKAIALAVLGMRAPILAPIVAMASNPRALRTRLVLAVVGIALPLGPLPTSPARALTGRCTAVLLIRDLRTWSERPAAARTPPPLHGRSLRPGKPERSSVQRMPTNEMARMPPPPQPSPSFRLAAPAGTTQIRPIDSDRRWVHSRERSPGYSEERRGPRSRK
jgi:hypothetical protein